jgi:hypothetical protein
MENIIHFFIDNKFKLFDYFKQVKINQKKTFVCFELKSEHKISITFKIHGETQKKEIPFEDKVKRLFHTDEDLSELDHLISEINLQYYFTFSPYIKISKNDEPLIHSFQLNIVLI